MKRRYTSFEEPSSLNPYSTRELKELFNTAAEQHHFVELYNILKPIDVSFFNYVFFLKKSTMYFTKNKEIYYGEKSLASTLTNRYFSFNTLLFEKINEVLNEKNRDDILSAWLASSLKENKLKLLVYIIFNVGILPEEGHTLFLASDIEYLLDKIRETLDENRVLSPPLNDISKNMDILFNGLGLLTRKGKFTGKIHAEKINVLLRHIVDFDDVNNQTIGWLSFALSELVKTARLEGVVSGHYFNKLLVIFADLKNIEAKTIGMVVYEAWELMRAGKLDELIVATTIDKLFSRLIHLNNVLARSLGMALYGAGELGKAFKLNGFIKAETLNQLLLKLLSLPDLNFQTIGMAIYAMGELAKAKKLSGSIDAETLNLLLAKFNDLPGVDFAARAMALYGLGELAKTRKLKGFIIADKINGLLAKITHHLVSGAFKLLSMSVLGTGELADTHCVQGTIIIDMKNMLEMFIDSNNIIAMTNIIWSIGLLKANGHQLLNFNEDLIKTLFLRIKTLLVTGQPNNDTHLIYIDDVEIAKKTLQSIAFLAPADLILPMAKELIEFLGQSYMHPQKALQIIHMLVYFKQYHVPLFSLFKHFIEIISSVSFERFLPVLRKQLIEDCKVLANTSWAALLANVINPTIKQTDNLKETEVDKYANNQHILFPLPDKKSTVVLPSKKELPLLEKIHSTIPTTQLTNSLSLKTYLNIDQLIFSEPVGSNIIKRRRGKKNIQPLRLEKASHQHSINKEARAWHFFLKTTRSQWHALINEKGGQDYRYYVDLLEPCSLHGRYKIAQFNGLLPILCHLPLNQLIPLINKLMGDFQFYRDHHSLLCIIDGLTIRYEKNKAEQETILRLQYQMVERALAFHHQSKHHHVVAKLATLQEKLATANQTFIDEECHTLKTDFFFANKIQKAITNHTSLAEKAPLVTEHVSETNSNNIVCSTYQYTAEEMQIILEARLKNGSSQIINHDKLDLHVLGSAQINKYLENSNTIGNVVTMFLHEGKYNKALNLVLLIPICVSCHWIGIRLTLNQGNILQVKYYNSKKSEADNKWINIIKADLINHHLINSTMNIDIDYNGAQQSKEDGTNCGPFLIENFFCDLTKKWWYDVKKESKANKGMVLNIRTKHLDLLKKDHAHRDFYQQFYKRQANNINDVPSLAIQLANHGLTRIPQLNHRAVVSSHTHASATIKQRK